MNSVSNTLRTTCAGRRRTNCIQIFMNEIQHTGDTMQYKIQRPSAVSPQGLAYAKASAKSRLSRSSCALRRYTVYGRTSVEHAGLENEIFETILLLLLQEIYGDRVRCIADRFFALCFDAFSAQCNDSNISSSSNSCALRQDKLIKRTVFHWYSPIVSSVVDDDDEEWMHGISHKF